MTDITLIGEVANGGRIYQSAFPGPDLPTLIQTAGRTVMLVNMAWDVDGEYFRQWVIDGSIKSILYCGIVDAPQGCLDDSSLLALALMCRAWLRRGGDIVFCCFGGVSRSGYINCATLMLTLGIGFDQALEIIRSKRPQANPNDGFTAHLRRMEPRFLDLSSA